MRTVAYIIRKWEEEKIITNKTKTHKIQNPYNMKCLMCLMASIGLMLLMSSSLSVEAKKPKKYIGENGGDFEFIDEPSRTRQGFYKKDREELKMDRQTGHDFKADVRPSKNNPKSSTGRQTVGRKNSSV
uniref:Uncharacterized protein n=1 Tax=Glossina palpalis gambiensis TaxID=67801 RepID=A0A1B0BRE5_9MUSC